MLSYTNSKMSIGKPFENQYIQFKYSQANTRIGNFYDPYKSTPGKSTKAGESSCSGSLKKGESLK
jgi:hypothetical protein